LITQGLWQKSGRILKNPLVSNHTLEEIRKVGGGKALLTFSFPLSPRSESSSNRDQTPTRFSGNSDSSLKKSPLMKIDVRHGDHRLGIESGSILKNALVAFHALTSSGVKQTPATIKGG
jgi:hypothetical protein